MTRFIVVRHPFARLVSAFRDKLEHFSGKGHYYDTYGSQIVRKYRERALKRFGQEFLSQTFDIERGKAMPTFWEFVQFVLDLKSPLQFDEHWQAISFFCQPCKVNFSHIIKLESYSVEEQWFHKFLGVNKALKPLYENRHRPGTSSQEKITQDYFHQLSLEDVQRLYKLYEEDFLMFGYRFNFGNQTFGCRAE